MDVSAQDNLHRQLLEDLHRLHDLILRYARGDRSARPQRDRLEGAVQIKFAIWQAMHRRSSGGKDPESPGR